jgi:diaminopimelate epimerase
MVLQKYCASGNDFLIFHSFKKEDRSTVAKEMCDRHYGFGADGLIALIPHPELDFEWQFYNSDGSEASMCGNGTRATALYAYDNQLAGKTQSFLTGAGIIKTEISEGCVVETELTPPEVVMGEFEENGFFWKLINTGVPHLVSRCAKGFFDLEMASKMRHKYNANVNFYSFEDDIVNVRTFERGVENETLACGTGMAACAYDLTLGGIERESFLIKPKSNENITIKVDERQILFKGAVKRVGSCLAHGLTF